MSETKDGDSTQANVNLTCGVDAEGVVKQLGQAGRFHLRVYVLVAFAAAQVGLLHTTYIFLAGDVPYRDLGLTQCDYGEHIQSVVYLLECPLCPNTCTREDPDKATLDHSMHASEGVPL